MIKLSELKMKEVILIKTGQRLGFIDDLIINKEEGIITSFTIEVRDMKSAFFKKTSERIIEWKQIVTIGKDTILINEEVKNVEESETEVDKKK